MKFRTWLCAILALCLFATLTAAAEDEPLYIENEWDYVDGSMDVSGGIPEDATGGLARVREAGVLRVATEPYFAPQEFIDPSLEGQAQYVGADIELAKLIARRMGVELEIVPMDFADVLDAVAEGDCDLAISGLAYTPGRAALVELSKGYHYAGDDTGTGLMIREADADKIVDVKSLATRDLVAQSGSLQESLMAGNVEFYRQFLRVSSTQAVFDAVRSGRADAAAVDVENARVYIRNNPDCGLTLVEGVTFEQALQYAGDRVAAKKGELQMMYFVNGVIDEVLADGRYEDWFGEFEAYAARLGV